MTTSIPVPALDRDLIGRLRADVIASTWTVENLQTLISEGALSALMRDSRLPALVELAGATDPAAINSGYHLAYLIGAGALAVAVVISMVVLRTPREAGAPNAVPVHAG